MAVSRLLVVNRLPRTQLFLDRFFNVRLDEHCEYWSKLDETWSESYRVGRSEASGRRPRPELGPEQTKKQQKIQKQKIEKLGAGQSLLYFLIFNYR